jgi:hypothetical protein
VVIVTGDGIALKGGDRVIGDDEEKEEEEEEG